jgi:hypothetical protein
MLSFNEFIDFKAIQPLLQETANLFVELDIEPTTFIEEFLNEDGYTTAGQNFQQGASQFGQGLWGGMKNTMGGLGQMGLASGQGARDWWKKKMDPANKINVAQQALARLAQGKMGTTALQGGQNVNAVIAAINNQLTQLRNQLPDPITGQPRGGVPTPAGSPTPGPSNPTPNMAGGNGGAQANPYGTFQATT